MRINLDLGLGLKVKVKGQGQTVKIVYALPFELIYGAKQVDIRTRLAEFISQW